MFHDQMVCHRMTLCYLQLPHQNRWLSELALTLHATIILNREKNINMHKLVIILTSITHLTTDQKKKGPVSICASLRENGKGKGREGVFK